MLIRYRQQEDGSSIPVADVYNKEEHGIAAQCIDRDALGIVRRLHNAGEQAYIVGGAVRDLLLKRKPKDFDIVTSATPRQVKKLFWNARIIGKRFKLVHIVCKDTIFEVSTFRSGSEWSKGGASIYGTIEQDAKRRDFTINSLYYDPIEEQLLDFNHAMADFKNRRIRAVLPLDNSFVEDPVRMVRAVKYAVITQFTLQSDIRKAIKKQASELARISESRLTEEVMKILNSQAAAPIMRELQQYRLLVYLLPCISVSQRFDQVEKSLSDLDKRLCASESTGEKVCQGAVLSALLSPLIVIEGEHLSPAELFKETYWQAKQLLFPITPPNYDVQDAVRRILVERGIPIPKRRDSAKTGQPLTTDRRKRAQEQQAL